jgi:hypothetical protein
VLLGIEQRAVQLVVCRHPLDVRILGVLVQLAQLSNQGCSIERADPDWGLEQGFCRG